MVLLKDVLEVCEPFKQLLTVTENDDYIRVAPKQYIADRQVYSDIGRAMHTLNAEYIKAGKDSHWRVLKAEANKKLSLAVNNVQEGVRLIREGLALLEQAGYQ